MSGTKMNTVPKGNTEGQAIFNERFMCLSVITNCVSGLQLEKR